MASKSTQKLCDIVTCPICLETLKNPKMLKCYHFFCNDCLLGTKRNPANGNFVCSMCRDETAQQHTTSVPIMNGLIEAIETAKKNEAPCIMCKTELPEYRCLDCKSLYCPGCKAGHDAIPMCAKHRCVRLSDAQAEIYVDELIFCKRHPDKVVELNCVQCNDMICFMCKAVDHNNHQVESITDSLKRILPRVHTNKQTLQRHIINCEATTEALISTSRDVQRYFDGLLIQVNSQFQAAIQKATEDRNILTSRLVQAKAKDMNQINGTIEQLTDKAKGITESITWTDNILATAHSTSLLQELQTGPSKRLLTIEEKIDYPELLATSLFQTDKLEFSPATDERENSIGQITVKVDYYEERGEDQEIEIEAARDGSCITLTYNPTLVQHNVQNVPVFGGYRRQQKLNARVGQRRRGAQDPFMKVHKGWNFPPGHQQMTINRSIDGEENIHVALPPLNFEATQDPANPQELIYAPIHFVPANAQTQPDGHVVRVDVPSWGVGDEVISQVYDVGRQLIATLRQFTKPQYQG